jgi:hypothetical protein
VVLTVRALDSDDAFVVKAADRGLGFSVGLSGNPASAAAQMEWMTKYLALEQAVRCEESAWRITVAPLVKGETVLDYISRRGLSDDDWKLGMQGIPTLMRAIWRHARSPIDPSLGLLLDHHFDNILVGFKQPPFQDDERGARARVVFVDQRDDGLYHPESTLEDALSDYLRIFKGNAYLRNS